MSACMPLPRRRTRVIVTLRQVLPVQIARIIWEPSWVEPNQLSFGVRCEHLFAASHYSDCAVWFQTVAKGLVDRFGQSGSVLIIFKCHRIFLFIR